MMTKHNIHYSEHISTCLSIIWCASYIYYDVSLINVLMKNIPLVLFKFGNEYTEFAFFFLNYINVFFFLTFDYISHHHYHPL